MRNRWVRYLAVLVAPTVLLTCGIVFNLLTLEAVGEYASVDRIVEEQRETGGLYNGFIHSVVSYKYSSYRQEKPEVVVIGSSRSLQVRDYFFDARFYNAGGEVRSPTDAFQQTDNLLRLHKPQHVVWFMDFFHFCSSSDSFRTNLRRPVTTLSQSTASVERGLVPFQLIAVKKVVGFGDYLSWGIGAAQTSRKGVRLFGLGVQKNLNSAFGPDGSLYRFLDGPLPRVSVRLEGGSARSVAVPLSGSMTAI